MPEYLVVRMKLISGSTLDALSDDAVNSAFVLFACARFGLRLGEAVGLHRNDWIDAVGTVVVLVRTNRTRGLKTLSSKRQVPLVETLSEPEQQLVEGVLTRWVHREGEDRNTPLLAHVDAEGFRATKAGISSRLLLLIKEVTRWQGSMVHHLRHGFVTRLLSLLAGRSQGAGIRVTAEQSRDACQLLLGRPEADRRTLRGISRAVGHSAPGISLSAYTHGLEQWLPRPVARHALSAMGASAWSSTPSNPASTPRCKTAEGPTGCEPLGCTSTCDCRPA